MTLIIGIDPGSVRTGFGIVHTEKNTITHVAHGHIAAKGGSLALRLHHICTTLKEIIATHQPDEAAIENVFVHRNVQTALKLGQARGSALIALAEYALPVHEYAPREIKKTTAGYGAATKEQVQFMVRSQLRLTKQPQVDAADALAIAICHCQHRAYLAKIAQVNEA